MTLPKFPKLLVATGLALAFGCAHFPYENKSEVKSVRILAVKADLPFAHPGETVNLEALIIDGREHPENGLPMHFYWFPTPCVNPPGGQYFNCFPYLEAEFPTLGVDVSSQLLEDTKHSITIPANALDGVVQTPGTSGEPKVTSWNFMMICAGRVQRKIRTDNYQENQSPFGCFDDAGNELPITEGTFGFTRVTVTSTERNNNPHLLTDKPILFRGIPVDPAVGIRVPKCRKDPVEIFTRGNCDTFGMDIQYSDDDAEIDPANLDANGKPGRETIYTDWYVTLGRFPEPRRIDRDPFKGRPPVPNNLYEPPRAPGRGIMWIVLHDNRGGTDWTSIPVEIFQPVSSQPLAPD